MKRIKKRRRIRTKAVLILLLIPVLLIGLGVLCYFTFFSPKISFKENPAVLEINESYNNKQFVSKLRKMEWKDIKVEGKINTKKLGTYKLVYTGKDHDFNLECEVKDSKKPVVTTQEQNVSIDGKIKASAFIKEIKDATKTKVSFKEDYDFDELGDKNIVILVEDEGENVAEAKAVVHVLPKDTTPPKISVHDFEVIKGGEVDYLSGVSATDDRDGQVEVKVNSDEVDIESPGTYTLNYTAKDKAGNVAKETAKIVVINPESADGKIIYLTIDDGPSANTPKILDILNRYDVKATFFVTGQFPGYASYIHEEYSQGNAIGLHTYSHHYELLYASDNAYFEDLAQISDLVKEQTGVESHLIRFPGGTSNTISANYSEGIMTRLSKEVVARGYQYYDWNAESGDGDSRLGASTLIERSKQYGESSPLYFLMHDHGGSTATVESLPTIIEYFKGKGYQFKVLSMGVPGYHHNINN